MTQIKTSELTGAALNWAVAQCDNRRIGFNHGGGLEVRGRTEDGAELPEAWDLWMPWYPSTDWSQGGPIIEREDISLVRFEHRWEATIGAYSQEIDHTCNGYAPYGPTPLIAAMRCYVASKLGDEVDIPEELV